MGTGAFQFPTPTRLDFGARSFTGPNSDDNRGDGYMSDDAAHAEMAAGGQADPYAWAYGLGMSPYGFGGYDGYGYGYLDVDTAQYSGGSAQGAEKWGEVDQTTQAELEEAGAIREYEEGSILVIANGPEDMRQLDHNAEADMITNALGGDRNVVVLWNPSADALQSMLSQGKFQDVVLSGHGAEGTVYMTGADGTAVAVDSQTFTGYFDDSGVQNVFLNMCHGAGGENSVAQSLADVGMNVLGWQTAVKDSQAQDTAGQFASLLADGTTTSDLAHAAATNENLTFIEGRTPDEAAAPAPAAEGVANPFVDPAEGIRYGSYDPYFGQFMYF